MVDGRDVRSQSNAACKTRRPQDVVQIGDVQAGEHLTTECVESQGLMPGVDCPQNFELAFCSQPELLDEGCWIAGIWYS